MHQVLTTAEIPQCPRWHQMALWLGWAGNIILVAAVIVFGVWGQTGRETTTNGIECNSSLKVSQSWLNQSLYPKPDNNSTEASGCKLCPPNWLLHTDKCYWVSKEKTPWNKSRDDCSKRSARLLTIRDQDEMAFIQTTSKDTNQIWLGLTITFPARKRIWVDGSLLNQTLFNVVDPAEGNSCGVIKADQIHFETCSAVSKWICEKDALLI
ncbi:killer cell lectin-like receptor subfamily B member 1B allele C [Mauremys reevesii]|uniref:killer cell lectin-like receptor subfamily B member 1B allele C n=1 Tax=Mauremys reevesii TaxID=260615 RepID=UPI00193F8F68|nr:killer cell lectin-like receptor subfamily B member 1B allele C [Mauremys reevesii]